MVLKEQLLTAADFDAFVARPENANRLFEYIGGRIVEVVSNNYSSEVAMFIGSMLTVFARQHGSGRVTGADGGYMVMGERYIPDVGYITKDRQPEPSQDAYNRNPPDLAVEVLSPSNDESDMRIKTVNYLRAGATVWIVNPAKQQVEIYAPDQSPRTVGMDGEIDGGALLPGFTLAVKDIFAG